MGENDFHSTRRCQPAADQSISDCVLAELETVKGHAFVEEKFVLYDYIDPDALDNLFQGKTDSTVSVNFCINGQTCITVYGDHEIVIHIDDLEDTLSTT